MFHPYSILLLLAVAIAAALAFGGGSASDCTGVERDYVDYKAAVSDSSGGIPTDIIDKYLPSSAENISYQFIYDTCGVWLRYKFAPRDLAVLTTDCSRTSIERTTLPNNPGTPIFCGKGRLQLSWPRVLTRRGGGKLGQQFRLYSCKRLSGAFDQMKTHLAIDTNKNVTYFWITRDEDS